MKIHIYLGYPTQFPNPELPSLGKIKRQIIAMICAMSIVVLVCHTCSTGVGAVRQTETSFIQNTNNVKKDFITVSHYVTHTNTHNG